MKTNLKPFDLKAALSGEPVMLRDGAKAHVRHHETELSTEIDETLLGYIEGGGVCSWCVDGASYGNEYESEYDIVGMYPKTHSINGFEVPAPETETPAIGSTFFVASTIFKKFFDSHIWRDYEFDKLWLERGLVFLTKEDAIANAKAMLGIDPL